MKEKIKKIMKNEKIDKEPSFEKDELPRENEKDGGENKDEFDLKKEATQSDDKDYNLNTSITEPPKESNFKKISKVVGIGGLVVGGWFFYILQFVFVAFAGLSMILLAISLFSEGSVIQGLLVLFIGTIAIGLASHFFIIFVILAIIALIIWGIIHIFGFGISFSSVWEGIWLIIKILLLGVMALLAIKGFIEAVREKRVLEFFKEYWWGILLFCLLLWFFFFK